MKTKTNVLRPLILIACAAVIFSVLCSFIPVVSAQRGPAAVASVRLYVFDLGTLTIADTTRFGFTKEQLATTDLSVVGYLIVHPKGTLMWDTGVVPDDQVGTGAKGADRAGKRTLKDQLAEIGYSEENITYFGLSHYHSDHSANANAFKDSTWIVQEPERETMFSDPPPAIAVSSEYDRLKDSKTIILHNVDPYDVFGDGTVLLKPAYGHTPGAQILMVKMKNAGWVALVGDLYHYPEERQARTIVPTFEFNKEQSIESRNRIEDYVKKMGAQMWIEHDYLLHAKLKKSPLYYD